MDKMNRLGEEKVSKLLLTFSLPAIVGMLVSACYNVIDRAFIGHSAGAPGLAGITIGFPIMIIQMAFGGLIGMGATSLVSIRLGEKKPEEAEKIMGNALVLLIIATVGITIIGHIFLDPILILFGASAEVLPYARDYMQVILWGSVFMMLSFGMNNFMRAEGKPGTAMATMIISAVLNVIFAPIFIFVLGWGMIGAGLATVVAQAIAACWIVGHFIMGKSTLKIRKKNLKLDWDICKRIMFIGMAPFFMQVAQSGVTAFINKSLEAFGGDIAISGWGIVNSLMTLIFMPILGINQGVQPIIGYNYGAKKYDRVRTGLKLAIFSATGIALVGYLATRIFPRQLIMIFNNTDQALIDFGTHAVTVAMLLIPVIGLQVVGAGYFQATGKPTQSMILSLSRQVLILVPLLFILPRFYGLDGVLAAFPSADVLSTILTGTWLFVELRRLNAKHQETVKEAQVSDSPTGEALG